MEDASTHAGPRLLPDDPADSDAFGSHDRIAESIVELIRSGDQGLAIGLIGEQGSGKSTIVEAVSKKLVGDTRIYSFDAWAHEGDPLRKAFLQGLRESQGSAISEDLSKKFDKTLNNSHEITRTITKARLRICGQMLAVSALFVPVGTAIVAAGSAFHGWGELAGFVLAFLPVAVSIFMYIGYRCGLIKVPPAATGQKGQDRAGTVDPAGKKNVGFIDLLRTQEETETFSDTEFTPEPTSLEFEELFRELISALGGKRVLIIFDNLDRLSCTDRDRAWSVLRTYTEALAKLRGEHQVWTLVPVTPQYHGRNLTVGENLTAEQISAGRIKQEQENSTLTKSLQAQFCVPPPLPSDWKQYGMDLFNEAGLGWSGDDVEIALAYFLAAMGGDLPTPRAIKIFINQVVVIECGAPPGTTRGACAALAAIWAKHPRWRPPEAIPTEFESTFRIPIGELAALYFRAVPARALQRAYGSEIYKALQVGAPGDMAGLFRQCPELGFAVQDAVQQNAGTLAKAGGGPALARAASALLGMPEDKPERPIPLRLLAQKLASAEDWPNFDERGVDGLAFLLTKFMTVETAGALLQRVANSFPQVSGTNVFPEWAGSVAKLCAKVKAASHSVALPCIGDTADKYINFMRQAVMIGYDARLQPDCPHSDVVRLLSERASEADLDWAGDVKSCLSAGGQWDWSPLVEVLGTALSRTGKASIDPLATAMLELYRCGYSERILTHFKAACGSGAFFQMIFGAELTVGEKIVLLFGRPSPQNNFQAQGGQIAQGWQRYRRWLSSPGDLKPVANAIGEADATDELWECRNFQEHKALVEAVLRELAAISQAWPSPKLMSVSWKELSSILDDEFWGKVGARADEVAAETEKLQFDLKSSPLYLYLSSRVSGDTFPSFLRAGLKTLSPDQWAEILRSGGESLDIAVSLSSSGPLDRAESLRDALDKIANGISKGQIPEAREEQVSALRGFFEKRALATLQSDLLDLFCNSGRQGKFLSKFGEFLVGVRPIISQAEQVIAKVLLTALKSRDKEVLDRIAPLVSACAEMARGQQNLESQIGEIVDLANEAELPAELADAIKLLGPFAAASAEPA